MRMKQTRRERRMVREPIPIVVRGRRPPLLRNDSEGGGQHEMR